MSNGTIQGNERSVLPDGGLTGTVSSSDAINDGLNSFRSYLNSLGINAAASNIISSSNSNYKFIDDADLREGLEKDLKAVIAVLKAYDEVIATKESEYIISTFTSNNITKNTFNHIDATINQIKKAKKLIGVWLGQLTDIYNSIMDYIDDYIMAKSRIDVFSGQSYVLNGLGNTKILDAKIELRSAKRMNRNVELLNKAEIGLKQSLRLFYNKLNILYTTQIIRVDSNQVKLTDIDKLFINDKSSQSALVKAQNELATYILNNKSKYMIKSNVDYKTLDNKDVLDKINQIGTYKDKDRMIQTINDVINTILKTKSTQTIYNVLIDTATKYFDSDDVKKLINELKTTPSADETMDKLRLNSQNSSEYYNTLVLAQTYYDNLNTIDKEVYGPQLIKIMKDVIAYINSDIPRSDGVELTIADIINHIHPNNNTQPTQQQPNRQNVSPPRTGTDQVLPNTLPISSVSSQPPPSLSSENQFVLRSQQRNESMIVDDEMNGGGSV